MTITDIDFAFYSSLFEEVHELLDRKPQSSWRLTNALKYAQRQLDDTQQMIHQYLTEDYTNTSTNNLLQYTTDSTAPTIWTKSEARNHFTGPFKQDT